MSLIPLWCSSGRCYGNHFFALPELLEEVDRNGNEQVRADEEQSHHRQRPLTIRGPVSVRMWSEVGLLGNCFVENLTMTSKQLLVS